MRATVDAKEFFQALDKVSKVVRKGSFPIFGGVLVQIKDDHCTLTGTDFNTWLTASLPAQGDDLSFVIQRPKDAARACRHFEGRLVLETEDKNNGNDRWLQLTMSCGPRAAQMGAFLPEDYPPVPKVREKDTYTVNAARLLERVEHVKYALRKPDGKLEAKFTHVQFSGNKVFGVDGYRLAWDIDDSLTVSRPFMVPPESLEYLKFFGDQEVTVSVGEHYLLINGGTTVVQARIEGPLVFNVDSAVPKTCAEEFYVYPQNFLRELDYLKKLVQSTDKDCVYFSGDILSLAAASGRYTTQVEIGGENSIGFGFALRYMVDALRQFREEPQIKVKVSSSSAPIVLEAKGRNDFALVLPVRMKEAAAA